MFCSQIILAIHLELLMQPIVVIGGVGTLLEYKVQQYSRQSLQLNGKK